MPRYRIRNTSDYIKKTIEELDARRDQDTHELMVMRHEAVTRYQEGMDKHDVIDPLAGVMY